MTINFHLLENGVYSGYYGRNSILISKNRDESFIIFRDGSTRLVELSDIGMIVITDKYSFKDYYAHN